MIRKDVAIISDTNVSEEENMTSADVKKALEAISLLGIYPKGFEVGIGTDTRVTHQRPRHSESWKRPGVCRRGSG